MGPIAKIVIITTEGSAKRDFINSLTRETSDAVKYAIIQKATSKSLIKRTKGIIKRVGIINFPTEIIFWLKNKLPKNKKVLGWVKNRTAPMANNEKYLPPIKITENINSDDIYHLLKEIKPDVIAIWGGKIIKPHILETATICLNIHKGLSPYYRGVSCNEHAILNNEIDKVGITIHYATQEVDAGNIITTIQANPNQSPKDFFKELNDKSMEQYKKIIKALANGEKIDSYQQDLSLGKCYTLKDWGFKKESLFIKKLRGWGKNFSNPT